MNLAQSLDLVEIGKAVGALGAPTLLGIGIYVVWSKLAAAEAKLQAAQDKLDSYQEARIKELAGLLAALGGDR